MVVKKHDLYGEEKEAKDKIQYEVIKLPLQDQVSSVRRVVSEIWKNFKVEKDKAVNSIRTSMQAIDTKVQDAMKSIGIKNTALALEGGAIGTAALVGAVFARRKSIGHRVAYPALAGGLVWTAMYCSSTENRSLIHSHIKSIQNTYLKPTKPRK